VPWPNRLRHGRWTWQGEPLQLDVRSPEEPHAIHGLACWQRWTVLEAAADRVTVATNVERHPGYPFRLAAAVEYRLSAGQLAVTVEVANLDTVYAPVGVGMHPYLAFGTTGDGGVGEVELSVPARTELVVDGGLPTGERRPFDGAVGRIGDRELDVPLTDLVRDEDGWARVRAVGPAGAVELAVDDAWPWLQVYSGHHLPPGQYRRSLAVEPMSCPPNALADGHDLVVLDPGELWVGRWTLAWTAA
jgi:aldose 1-epimerase